MSTLFHAAVGVGLQCTCGVQWKGIACLCGARVRCGYYICIPHTNPLQALCSGFVGFERSEVFTRPRNNAIHT